MAAVYYDRGNAEVKLNKSDAAFADFSKAIALKPEFDFAVHNRGMIYDDRGEYKLAIADFTKAIAISPQVRGHYYNRARVYMHAGYFDLAVQDYTAALKLWPDEGAPLAGRCRALAAEGADLAAALTDCERTLAFDPDNSMFLTLRAFVKLKQRDFEGVIADCDTALGTSAQKWTGGPKWQLKEIQPADALLLKGLADLNLGKKDAGKTDVATSTKQDSDIISRYVKMGVSVPNDN